MRAELSVIRGFNLEQEKLAKTKDYSEYNRAIDNPFYKAAPDFKSLKRYQKLRIGAGISANLAFGALPIAAAGVYGARRLLNKGPSYREKYEEAQKEIQARDKALQIAAAQRNT